MRRAAIVRGWPLAALLVVGLLGACAHAPRSLGSSLSPAEQAARRAQLGHARPAPTLWSADGLLVAFARGERVRLRVQVLATADGRFRATALGPHNAAVWTVASDGNVVTQLDGRSGQFGRAPATREGLRALTGGLDVGMPLAALLGLLAGHLDVPGDAEAFGRPHAQTAWRWQRPAEAAAAAAAQTPELWQALADQAGRIVAVHVARQAAGDVQVFLAPSSDPAAPPIARSIEVRLGDGAGKAVSTIALELNPVDVAPTVGAVNPFVVAPGP